MRVEQTLQIAHLLDLAGEEFTVMSLRFVEGLMAVGALLKRQERSRGTRNFDAFNFTNRNLRRKKGTGTSLPTKRSRAIVALAAL